MKRISFLFLLCLIKTKFSILTKSRIFLNIYFSTIAADIREQLIHTIMKTFNYTKSQANNLFKELMMCVKKRDLVKKISFLLIEEKMLIIVCF